MNRKSILISQPQPPATNPRTATATQARPATETTMAQSGVQRPMTGTFSGTLPCAECAGIDETLRLDPDGNFALTDAYRERPGSTHVVHVVHGRWSTENDGARLRLTPDEKRSVVRMFAIDDNNTLTQLGMDGTRIDSALDYSLQRGR